MMQQKSRPKKEQALPSQQETPGEKPQIYPKGCPDEKGFAVLLKWSATHGWVCKIGDFMW